MSFGPNLTHESTPVHERVILAIAEAEGVDQTDLDPLYETIDPDALDALFKSGVDGSLRFRYAGHTVVVRGDGNASVDGVEVAVTAGQTVDASDEFEAGTTGH